MTSRCKIFLLMFLSFINFSIQDFNVYFTPELPGLYRNEFDQDLTCVGGPNPPKQIFVRFVSRGIEPVGTGTYFAAPIKDIQGAKLVNKDNEEKFIPLTCYDDLARFYCNVTFGVGETIEPGEYYFAAEEELSGSPYPSAIRKTKSEATFPVSKKAYQKFPYTPDSWVTVDFVKGKGNIEIHYSEDILEVPVMTYGSKQFDCKVSASDGQLLLCPITDKDFTPTETGNEYSVKFINVCGQEEGTLMIRARIGINTETDIFMSYVLPSIIGAVVIIAVVVIIVVVKLNKNKGDKDLGEIMQTSYASEEDKRKQQQQDEGLVQETLA